MLLSRTHTFKGGRLVLSDHPVFSRHSHKSKRSEALGLLVELLGGTSRPAATKEEDNRGSLVGQFVSFGIEDVQGEFGMVDGLVYNLLVGQDRFLCEGCA